MAAKSRCVNVAVIALSGDCAVTGGNGGPRSETLGLEQRRADAERPRAPQRETVDTFRRIESQREGGAVAAVEQKPDWYHARDGPASSVLQER